MPEGDDYVECSECGHPLERHTVGQGCTVDECPCDERWSRSDIEDARHRNGLRAYFHREDY